MTDNVSESIESIESTESRASAPDAQNLDNSPGAQLRRAREKAGLSCEELSRRLCMTGNKLELLERDEYERLPSALYVRGYIRNACKELKLDPEPVLRAYSGFAAAEEESREILAHVSRGPVVEARKKRSYKGLALLPLVAVAGVFWWVNDRGLTPPALTGTFHSGTQAEEVAAEPQAAESKAFAATAPVSGAVDEPSTRVAGSEVGAALEKEPDMSPVSEPADVAGEISTPAAEEQAEAVAQSAAAVPQPEPDFVEEQAAAVEVAGSVADVTEERSLDPAPAVTPATESVATTAGAATESIQLQFDEEAWIEVKDATGSVLLAKLKPAGSQVTLEGQPPFSLMLGNATGTHVRYHGELVDSDPIGSRRTRRLTVGN